MSAARQFFDAIARAKRNLTATPPDDDEAICNECQGTGLAGDEDDAPPCVYCDGSGLW